MSLELFIDIILPAALRVDSVSNRNEYQEYFLGGKGGGCVGLTTLPPSCAECLEIWEPHQPPGTLRACSGLYRDGLTFYIYQDIRTTTAFFLGYNFICIIKNNHCLQLSPVICIFKNYHCIELSSYSKLYLQHTYLYQSLY